MVRKQLTAKQKRSDIDLWIIGLVTLGVYLTFVIMGKQIMGYITNSNISVIPRLFLNAALQFGIAGLGITIVCILRKERFTQYGLHANNTFKAIIGTVICFIPYIIYISVTGQFKGYQPFRISITKDVLSSGIPTSLWGMALIILVWGFFEGFNYVVIHKKINKRYPSPNPWMDYGAITCAIICILFHPFSLSIIGLFDMATIFIAIYGMLIVKRMTGNAWGCVFAFCFIWNAF